MFCRLTSSDQWVSFCSNFGKTHKKICNGDCILFARILHLWKRSCRFWLYYYWKVTVLEVYIIFAWWCWACCTLWINSIWPQWIIIILLLLIHITDDSLKDFVLMLTGDLEVNFLIVFISCLGIPLINSYKMNRDIFPVLFLKWPKYDIIFSLNTQESLLLSCLDLAFLCGKTVNTDLVSRKSIHH